ncbi:UBX domain-containing protein 6 isoform X1 [Dunckerocampus dactyliophorus]|uniref:UBX domain-containing protein 6 isoform X1 n=1 Tax=Dunckerocampus dactyliophorus TaxID=161453 RepID=UPI0024063E33|nr:UBX domain-containing protein 6 isoform X1 [Dunckerocampus dactyliophorus]
MKKFFDDIKKDMKFKSAGPGKKLTEDSSAAPDRDQRSSGAKQQHRDAPSEGSQRAGAAALARIEQQRRPKVHTSQDAIRNQVKRELEAEASALADQDKAETAEGTDVASKDRPCLSVSGVYFTCPLTGATLTKLQRDVHIKEAILMRFEEDAIEASVMMIYTFNKDKEKVKAAVDIISKYVENICKNPSDDKYRKLKLSNKVFQDKVRGVEGSREFLQALGFTSTMLPVDGQEEDEEFLVLPEQSPDALELMKERRDRLQRGEPVRAQLDRQAQAFRASDGATRFELPPEFYSLTAEELKREQQQRSDLVEKNSMLRTKAMRERDEQRERRKYNYTLLRIRLPDGNLLQGTFYAWDRLSVLFAFVRDSLVDGWQPFELIAPGGHKLHESSDVALAECNLVPAALLSLAWDGAVQADIAAAGGKRSDLLKPELVQNIRTLS